MHHFMSGIAGMTPCRRTLNPLVPGPLFRADGPVQKPIARNGREERAL
jgi:hypothetical protein